ncbi:MAG: type IV toxin-antitoxin system AbiEi family antitoxin domain-containing protein [Nakamurella sp.]
MHKGQIRSAAETLAELPDGVFSQTEAARGGLSARSLYRMRDAGQLEVVGRGLYRRAHAAPADLDLLEIGARSRLATICLTSALARHGLIDVIPARIDMAIPRGSHHPRVQTAVRWHSFDSNTFELGRGDIPVEGTEVRIGLYKAERSIVDAFRLRGHLGYELGVEALRSWLRQRGSHPAKLLRFAQQLPRAERPVRQALEYLS